MHEPTLNYGLCSQAYSYCQLNKELKNKNQLLNLQSSQFVAQRDTLQKLNKELQKLLKSTGEVDTIENRLKKLNKKLSSQIKDHENRKLFEEHLNLFNADLSKKLKHLCPSLAYEELKICGL